MPGYSVTASRESSDEKDPKSQRGGKKKERDGKRYAGGEATSQPAPSVGDIEEVVSLPPSNMVIDLLKHRPKDPVETKKSQRNRAFAGVSQTKGSAVGVSKLNKQL